MESHTFLFVVCSHNRPGEDATMRSRTGLSALCVVAFALGASSGCSGSSGGPTQTDLAKLPLPPQAVIDAAKKAEARPKARPKFGAIPRSEMLKAMRKP